MTSTDFPSTGTTPPDLGLFQRAALSAGTRRLGLRVHVPNTAPQRLLDALTGAIAAFPVLTSVHVPVAELRVPRQASMPLTVRAVDGGWELEGGTLRGAVGATASGTSLDFSCETAFADTASIGLLLAEVRQRLDGGPGAEAPDFAAVAQGHNAMWRDGELADEELFWATCKHRNADDGLRLADVLPHLDNGGTAPITLRRRLTNDRDDRLVALAAETDNTPAELALLALATLTLRLGLSRTALGATADARELMGLPGVVGPLTQVVPVGWQVELDANARTALRTVREQSAETAQMIGGPAFSPEDARPDLVFDHAGAPVVPQGWELLSWSCPVDGEITLGMRAEGGHWLLRAESAGPVAHGRVEALLSMWCAVVDTLVQQPERSLAELPLVSPRAAATVAAALATHREPAESLVSRLHRHITETPDVPAYRRGEQTWTYRWLGERIAAISAALADVPVGGVVAVLAEPEPDLVAALAAVLWRGAVFLPLSVQEPTERITDALRRSGAVALLTGTNGVPPAGVDVIRLSALPARPLDAPAEVPADALAYLLRTSGSTGLPKLVGIRRESLENYLRWVEESLLVDWVELPVVSSPIFDASLKQTLGPVYAGRAVRLLEADRLDPAAVQAELAALDTPVALNCVPSYLSALLAEDTGTMPVRRFLVGDEPLPSELVARVQRAYPEAEVWNLYGPTETTATATAGRIFADDDVHVGPPVAGAQVVITDERGAVLPDGVRGEVVIAGPGLGVGYLSDHSGQFPFAPLVLGGETFPSYRTGDLGVLDRRGFLRLYGRKDDQIKLNGWRIEPREIEQAAQRVPGVRDAVAVLDDRPAHPCLRVFVTGSAETDEVTARLREVLPPQMLPESATVVTRLATTATGKVDRRALLDSVSLRPEASPEDYDPEQLAVATAWREVVQRGWPHPDEDFFAAGGHSLRLARLVNLLRSRGYEQLSLRQVVRNPTVESIARLIRDA